MKWKTFFGIGRAEKFEEEKIRPVAGPPARELRPAWMNQNPAAQLQTIWAQRSTATAFGFFVADQQLWDLLDEMYDRDAVIRSCIHVLRSGLVTRERMVSFSEEQQEDSRTKEIRDFVLDLLTEHAGIFDTMMLGLGRHGVVFLECLWQARNGRLVPVQFLHAHPGQFKYDPKQGRFVFYQSGRAPNPGEIFHTNLPGLYETALGESPIWPLRWLYVMKKALLVSQVNNAEANGRPIVHAQVPIGSAERGQLAAEFLAALQTLPGGGVIVTANGETIDVHQRSAGQGVSEIYSDPIGYIDSLIRTCLLGSELATKAGENGSRAASQTHEGVMLRTIAPYAGPITRLIQDLIRMVVQVNFGHDAPVPRFEIDFEIPADAEQTRKTLELAWKIGLPVAYQEAREKLGLRAPEDDEPVIVGQGGQSPDPTPSGMSKKKAPAKFDRSEIDRIHAAYMSTVNMTAGELRDWAETDCSRRASVDRAPIRRNLRLLEKAKSAWTEQDARDANRTISFVARMRGAMGDPNNTVSKACPFTRAEISLANWAWASPRIRRAMKFGRGSESADHFARTNSEMKQVAELAVLRSDQIKESVIPGIMVEANEDLTRALRGMVTRAQDGHMGLDSLVEPRDEKYLDLATAKTLDHMERMVACAMLIACSERAKIRAAFRDTGSRFSIGSLAGTEFEQAARWILSRKAMSQEEMDAAAQELVDQFGGNLADAQAFVRQTSFVLTQAADVGLLEQVQNLIARSVRDGLTLREFADSLFQPGDNPSRKLSAYWEMVFRTEMAQAYAEQQRQMETDPDLKDAFWGYEYMNPVDERSRPGHAALNGVMVKLDSPEFAAIGRPPFAYACRCTMAPLIMVEPKEYRQTKGAANKATGVERFSRSEKSAEHPGACCGMDST